MEENKKTATTWIEEHPKTIFWTRLVFWVLFACVLPFLFIGYRFDLFQHISKIKISGWGIFAIIIVAVFIFVLIRYVKLGFVGTYNFGVQCFNGFTKVILPLLLVALIVNAVKSEIEYFSQALNFVILSEIIAIPINPMPKWVNDKQKSIRAEERKGTVDYLLSEIKRKKDE